MTLTTSRDVLVMFKMFLTKAFLLVCLSTLAPLNFGTFIVHILRCAAANTAPKSRCRATDLCLVVSFSSIVVLTINYFWFFLRSRQCKTFGKMLPFGVHNDDWRSSCTVPASLHDYSPCESRRVGVTDGSKSPVLDGKTI